jgi:hypothetical protein
VTLADFGLRGPSVTLVELSLFSQLSLRFLPRQLFDNRPTPTFSPRDFALWMPTLATRLVLGFCRVMHEVSYFPIFSAFRTFGEMILMQLLFQSDSTLKKAALFGCPSPGDCYLPVLLSDLLCSLLFTVSYFAAQS